VANTRYYIVFPLVNAMAFITKSKFLNAAVINTRKFLSEFDRERYLSEDCKFYTKYRI